jgi:hypothetical protein
MLSSFSLYDHHIGSEMLSWSINFFVSTYIKVLPMYNLINRGDSLILEEEAANLRKDRGRSAEVVPT